MLDTDGYVCEGPAENIFIAKGKHLLTPYALKCLNGITRRSVMAVAPGLDMSVSEANLTLYDMYDADEIFSTGSLNDITWISELDGRSIGRNEPGPAVRRLLPAVRKRGFARGTPI
jgi:branched-chain amino acid aminotransferase